MASTNCYTIAADKWNAANKLNVSFEAPGQMAPDKNPDSSVSRRVRKKSGIRAGVYDRPDGKELQVEISSHQAAKLGWERSCKIELTKLQAIGDTQYFLLKKAEGSGNGRKLCRSRTRARRFTVTLPADANLCLMTLKKAENATAVDGGILMQLPTIKSAAKFFIHQYDLFQEAANDS